MGHSAIKCHIKTDKHAKELEDYNTIKPMTHFVQQTNVTASDKTHAAELALAYHTAFHNHAQLSASCTSDLIPELFSDSEVGKRYMSARTKSTKLVTKVLHPHFKGTFLDEITASGGYFSVGMDASNHKETKLYAITIRFLFPRFSTVGHFRLILSGLARDKFFGNATEEALEQLAELTRVEDDFCTFYAESLDFFERWFSYLDDYKDMQWLELREQSFNFQALRKSYRKYISTDSDRLDKLYVEFQMAKGTMDQLQDTSFTTMTIPNKWLVVLKNSNLVELRLLVSALLSIFPSNAYCETVFSHINNILTDSKINLGVDTLNALVSVVCNTPYKGCVDAFHNFLTSPELIEKARSNDKYE